MYGKKKKKSVKKDSDLIAVITSSFDDSKLKKFNQANIHEITVPLQYFKKYWYFKKYILQKIAGGREIK